jgi:uncharacterized lipoprotein YmbA
VAVGSALLLSACSSQGGDDLARQACVHVKLSVRYFEASTKASAADAARLRMKASAQLRAALPFAAQATSSDGSMNALMTTISEGATVDEAHLLPALKGQCKSVDTNINVNPTPGGLPGSNVNPTPGKLPGANVNPTPGT